MKLSHCLVIYVSCILSAPQDKVQLPGCITKMECKMNDIFEKTKTDKNFMKCLKFSDDEEAMYNCVFKLAGLRDDQLKLMSNLMSISYSCEPSSGPQLKECISKCASNKPCMETCADKKNEKSIECLANHLNIKDFDAKKSVQCSKQCTQDSLSEIIDCDTKCNEPLYNKIESDADDSKSSKDTSSTSTTTAKPDSKNPEPTGNANESNNNPSSGIANLSTGLFTIISVPILLSIVL